jgi:CubicO group peptidase (beta-lactamase class C family)
MNANKSLVPKTAAELGIGQGIGLPAEQRADTSNWTLPPFNRWSFQRVQQFTRTVRVPRADTPSVLENEPEDLSRITFDDVAGGQSTVADMLTHTYTDGFLVLHKGKVLTEQYFNGMDRSTLHLIMSCSKSVTSAVAGIYIDSGSLDPSALITDYLPELANSGVAGATVQHALDMQVGVEFNEDYEDLDADWARYEIATGWRENPKYDGPRDQISFAETLKPDGTAHGSVFVYQSVLTNILGCCLERAAGEKFGEMLARHIWHPMGAEQDFVSVIDSTGTVSFEGGFNMCLRDFARFGRLIAQNGRHQDHQLVPEQWLNNCRFPDPALVSAFADSEYDDEVKVLLSAGADGKVTGAYHNKWWVKDPARGIVMAIGVNGQMLYIDPERDFVAAVLSSQPDHVDPNVWLSRIRAFETIAEIVC